MAHTIALVDDDRNILTGISMALEREGFKVQTYIDGESALIGLTRNCLLYTSPSPRDDELSRMPSSA